MFFASLHGGTKGRLVLLSVILFIAYLCIGVSLPVIPLYVTGVLGFGNVSAGFAVGTVFFVTIVTRSPAGNLADRHGAKWATTRGLVLYTLGAALASLSGCLESHPLAAFIALVAGRLVLGFGESLVSIGIISWGIGLVGPAQSGRVLALVGASIYGALAAGGPLGLALFSRYGFTFTMAFGAFLSLLGLLAIAPLANMPGHGVTVRPPFRKVLARIYTPGLIVCLQGVGFAVIGAFFVLKFHWSGWDYAGFGLTAFGTGFVLVRLLFGHLPDRLGGANVAMVSLAVEALGQALIASAQSPLPAFIGAFLTGLGCSMIFPAMGREVVHRVAPELRGTALGAFSAFQDLAYGLTGPLAGFLADRSGYDSVFVAGCSAAVAALVLALALRSQTTGRPV